MTDEGRRDIEAIEEAQIEASKDEWKLISLKARQSQLDNAIAALKATSKHGVALVKAGIFDVSEYTEGTGFSATVLNSGKKTIKYVTFSVIGMNAVKDPVRGRFGASTTTVLRGIGPIEPDEAAEYSKDYMWMSDMVDSFRITQIKLEFMDGTSKVLTDMRSIRLSAKDFGQLSTDAD
jgi:hypothetical protein